MLAYTTNRRYGYMLAFRRWNRHAEFLLGLQGFYATGERLWRIVIDCLLASIFEDLSDCGFSTIRALCICLIQGLRHEDVCAFLCYQCASKANKSFHGNNADSDCRCRGVRYAARDIVHPSGFDQGHWNSRYDTSWICTSCRTYA